MCQNTDSSGTADTLCAKRRVPRCLETVDSVSGAAAVCRLSMSRVIMTTDIAAVIQDRLEAVIGSPR